MSQQPPPSGLELRSTLSESGQLALTLERVDTPAPKPHEVVVRVEAAPLNPSDMALLLGGADLTTLAAVGTGDTPQTTADVPAAAVRMMGARLGKSMAVGNEGAGTVVAAGSSAEAQALLGKTVSMLGGAMYTQYRCLAAAQCQPLPEGTTAAEGASWFVNPMTALGMVETMRAEGHTALVHTAAASNLGQMLQKLCLEEGIKLVNVVRKPEQAALLKELGAEYVCDSSSPAFMEELTEAVAATSATLAFDAIGGGKLVGQILTAMEVAATRKADSYSRYGSTTHKQAYIYGGLDRSQTTLSRGFGMAWGIGGWLLTYFLQKAGQETANRLRERVANGLKTTFKSHYAGSLSLREAVDPANVAVYGKQATGEKYLIVPSKA